MRMPGVEAYAQLMRNLKTKAGRIPTKHDVKRFDGLGFIPKVDPKFSITKGQKIFTIGSCFAREIDSILKDKGYEVPITDFFVPPNEINDLPPAHMLNEYNVGTIAQRLSNAAGGFEYLSSRGVEQTPYDDKWFDLFLHVHSLPVELPRLLQRRIEVETLYKQVATSDVIVITLGLIECWYDVKFECFLNKAPSKACVAAEPNRYEFIQMEVEDVVKYLSEAIQLLNDTNIILTVSPIPSYVTFTDDDIITSTCYAKSVLRVAATQIARQFKNVDYFPSFEIATSHGVAGLHEDNIHLLSSVVSTITDHMISTYEKN